MDYLWKLVLVCTIITIGAVAAILLYRPVSTGADVYIHHLGFQRMIG